ncbi:MAG: UvrD-helicase domain-containing protein [Spirochaetaceae bacterium]|nr:UvrD-helicase domain-containing protein [Spirochaetaceae bacterium]
MDFIPQPRTRPSADEYLSVLNPEQRAAVEHSGSPLLILAGAGSGKTRVITTKIAYLIGQKNLPPYSILAVTFTKKAATEMKERAIRLHPDAKDSQIRTFHSFGSWFLRQHTEEAGIDANFTVYDDDDMVTLLQKAVPGITRQEANHFAHSISRAKDYCMKPDSPELSSIDEATNFPQIYQAYQNRLRETGNIDFGDLIMLPVLLLEGRPEIREHMHRRFRVIMVDEYQDSNVAQFKLLRLLVGSETYVCVVGDDDQSIYSFRGAEVQNILTFPEHFPGTTIIKLERNYRSVPEVLNVANDVISYNKNRFDKALKATRLSGDKPVLTFLDNNYDETDFCAQVIKNAYNQGIPYNDWALLYRTNNQSLGFETEFLHQKIPYVIVGSLKFYDREEIKDALAYLAFVVNPKDEVSFRRVVNKPSRGIGDKTQDKIVIDSRNFAKDSLLGESNLLESCRRIAKDSTKKVKEGLKNFVGILDTLVNLLEEGQKLAEPLPVTLLAEDATSNLEVMSTEVSKEDSMSNSIENSPKKLSHLIEELVKLSGLEEYHRGQDEISGTQRVSNLQELANSAILYPLSRDGLLDFLDHIELDKSLDARDQEADEAVTLITVHNTKGLEFPRVLMTGLETGIFPRSDKQEEELEEERRLFYVGVTRAKDQLIMTSCKKRFRFGKIDEMYPSIFLSEIQQNNLRFLGEKPKGFCSLSSAKEDNTIHPLANRWKKGVRVFHDEYGYGYIINAVIEAEEYVITVKFDTGAEKRLMPEYQSHSLMVCEEENT